MTSLSSAELHYMLKPWLEHARDCMSVPWPDNLARADDMASDLWIKWTLPAVNPPHDKKRGVMDTEAMELLDLFVRVDYRAGWGAIFEALDVPLHLQVVLDAALLPSERRVYPRFRVCDLHFLAVESFSSFEAFLGQLVCDVRPLEHTSAFYAVRQVFIQRLAEDGSKGATLPRESRDRIPVVLTLDFHQLKTMKANALEIGLHEITKGAEGMIRCLSTNAALLADPSRYEALLGASNTKSFRRANQVFKVSLHVDFVGDPGLAMLLQQVQSIGASGAILFRSFLLRDVANCVGLAPLPMVSFFRSTLVSNPSDSLPSTFRLEGDTSICVFQAVMSALRANRSVRELSLSLEKRGRGCRDWVWSWIAFSLFSREATHRIQKLKLNFGEVGTLLIRAFRRVLKARDSLAGVGVLPEETNVSGPAELMREPTEAAVPCGAPLVFRIGCTEQIVELKADDQSQLLRVVENSPGKSHVCVLYPGAGFCWVARTHIASLKPAKLPRERSRVIRQLDLGASKAANIRILIRFLQLIGQPLTKLQLRFGAVPRDDRDVLGHVAMQELFAACPSLQRLDLVDAKVQDFDWLLNSGKALQALSLRGVETENEEGYQRLFDIVAGCEHGELTQLHLKLRARRLRELFQWILHAIDGNPALERFTLSKYQKDKPLSATHLDELAARNGQELSGQTPKLPLHCKIAFLSVFAGANDKEPAESACKRQRRAFPDVDNNLFDNIFQFAAPVKVRVCGFV